MKMAKIKTAELTRGALAWAVAMSLGWADAKITAYDTPALPEEVFFRPAKIVDGVEVCGSGCRWEPDTDWSQGGPLIDSEDIAIGHGNSGEHPDNKFSASKLGVHPWAIMATGPSKLIAAMRCLVASRMGDEVEVPEVLLDGDAKA